MHDGWWRRLCRGLERTDFFHHATATAASVLLLPFALWGTFAPMTTPKDRLREVRGEILDARPVQCIEQSRKYLWSASACADGTSLRYRTPDGVVQTAVFRASKYPAFKPEHYPVGATMVGLVSIEKPVTSAIQFPERVLVNDVRVKSLSGPPVQERLMTLLLTIFCGLFIASFAGRLQYRAFEDKVLGR